MFTHLKEIYKDLNKLEEARDVFHFLVIKNSYNYYNFLTNFLYLISKA